jgi:NAD(P)-dependent dehydrogenase (short-subunit alcohol dehydrogenase family)
MSTVEPAAATLAGMLDLTGRVVIVTGAAQGLGRAISERAAEAGATLVLADLDEALVRDVADDLAGRRRRATSIRADISERGDVDGLVAHALEQHDRIDALVNNAGIFPIVDFFEADESVWERTVYVNLMGTMTTSRAVSRQMIAQGDGGTIVNIASVAADMAVSSGSMAAYGASKAGVVNFTRVLAKELARHRIRVNSLLPGGMVTPGMPSGGRDGSAIPLGHRAHPDEVARGALFLLSELSAYMTGAEVVIDGGYRL